MPRQVHGSRSRHHLLYQRIHWQQGYAKMLRAEKYFILRIPNDLHAAIHTQIHDIPTPDGRACKIAYLELKRRLANHTLSPGSDSLMQRLSFLIEVWEESCPITATILKWQRDIVGEYYAKH